LLSLFGEVLRFKNGERKDTTSMKRGDHGRGTLQSQVAQAGVIIRTAAQRPMIFAI
jgi:hypothetical protein